MKVACNYSPALMELLAQGGTDVDYIKAGAFGPFLQELPNMRAARPVLLHGMGAHERTGMPGYAALDFNRMNALLAECGSPHLAIHLCVRNADAEPGMTAGGIERRMAACARHFIANLRVPLLLENTGDTPEERRDYDLIPFVEPDRIAAVLRDSGASFLLDVTHAKVTAQFRGWDLKNYLAALPLEKVKEVHLTGSGFDAAGAPYDAHGPLEEADFDTLEWVLGRARPGIVTFEYGGPAGFQGVETDAGVLREQLNRIRGIAGERRPGGL